MRPRVIRTLGWTFGVSVEPLTRRWRGLYVALHLGPFTLLWPMRWWL